MPSPYTLYDLTHITDYFGFEPFCTDLMSLQGHSEIIPLGGSSDKGRDGILHSSTQHIIFAYSVRNDWRIKLFQDLDSIKKNSHICTSVVFVSNADVSASEYDTLIQDVKSKYRWDLEIYDIKRISTLVDNHHPELIDRYPGLFKLSSTVKKTDDAYTSDEYCIRFLSESDQFNKEYTSLVANHKTITAFVTEASEEDDYVKKIPIIDIPQLSSVSFLLGESGAGKSTSLWQIVQTYCRNITSGKEGMVPVLVTLRNWNINLKCEQLVYDQFTVRGFDKNSIKSALKSGGLYYNIRRVKRSFRR